MIDRIPAKIRKGRREKAVTDSGSMIELMEISEDQVLDMEPGRMQVKEQQNSITILSWQGLDDSRHMENGGNMCEGPINYGRGEVKFLEGGHFRSSRVEELNLKTGMTKTEILSEGDNIIPGGKVGRDIIKL